MLEVGSVVGRFNGVFLRITSEFRHSVDYSSAVDAHRRNNAAYGDRLQLAHSSI